MLYRTLSKLNLGNHLLGQQIRKNAREQIKNFSCSVRVQYLNSNPLKYSSLQSIPHISFFKVNFIDNLCVHNGIANCTHWNLFCHKLCFRYDDFHNYHCEVQF